VTVRFRITGTEMPGRRCGPAQGLEVDRANIHVGVQRGRDVVDLVAGDASRAFFEFDVDVRAGRFSGPFVHGRGDERFLYLSWGEVAEDGDFTMFRRAKLQLDSLDATASDGATIDGRLPMSYPQGGPVCASIRPPAITWTVTPKR
jgi:hypothetical protein